MNGVLERRYRRVLRVYPKAFRREREEEILAVLLAGAADGQTRPRLTEWLNLLVHAAWWRVRHTSVPPAWEYRHAAVMLPARVVSGVVLLGLAAVLCGYDRAGWWTPVLLPAALAHFYAAGRLAQRPTPPPAVLD